MKRNVASQLISAQLVATADGSEVTTGTTTVTVEIDGAAGTGGTATHIANGKWEYAPIQADTNGDYLTFQFTNTAAITTTVQVYTNFPQTVDNNVLAAGATGFAAIDTVVDTINSNVGTAGAGLTNLGGSGNNWNVGKTGYTVSTVSDKTGYSLTVTPPTAAAISDAVWDETMADHLTGGSTGASLNGAGSAGDPWTTALPGAYGAGTAGNILGTNLDVAASTLATAAALTTVDNEIATMQGNVTDILTDTGTTIPAQITALNDLSITDVLTTQMTESYAADGTAPTLAQAIFLIQQTIGDFAIAGTTITTKKLDGSTTAATYTLDDGTNPTSRTRAT